MNVALIYLTTWVFAVNLLLPTTTLSSYIHFPTQIQFMRLSMAS